MFGAIIGDGSAMPQLAFDHADIMRDADHSEACSAYQRVKPSWLSSHLATGLRNQDNHSTDLWTTS